MSKNCFDGYHAGKVRDFIDLDEDMICCIIPKIEEEVARALIPENLMDRVVFVEHKEAKDIFKWTSRVYKIANERGEFIHVLIET